MKTVHKLISICFHCIKVKAYKAHKWKSFFLAQTNYLTSINLSRLYLQVTLSSLITNGTVQWVVGQQELHHSLSNDTHIEIH